MVKNILSILTGLVVAFAVIYAMELAGHRIYPVPEHIDYKNKEAITAIARSLPIGAFMLVLLAHALGSLAGGFCATAISRKNGFRSVIVISILLTAAGIGNLIMILHPLWFMIVDVLLYFPFLYLGYRLALKWLAAPAS